MGQTDSAEILECWKAIAAYLKKDVRTVQRWERTRGLPVHRTPGGEKAAVYAFKSELSEWLLQAGAEGPRSSLSRNSLPFFRTLSWLLLFSAGCTAGALLLITGIGMRRTPNSPDTVPVLMSFTPLTADGGWKDEPRLSPDAERVAYRWDGFDGNNFDIYVKATNLNSLPLRLTNHPANDHSPEWSPDGREIAFTRIFEDGSGAIYTVPSMGGHERRLVHLEGVSRLLRGPGNSLAAVSWSPDGEALVYAESETQEGPAHLVRLELSTLEKRLLTSPPPGTEGDYYPEYSPDGRRIAFLRGSSSKADVWVLSVAQGTVSPLTSTGLMFATRPAWTTDGRSILFSSGHPPRLYRVEADSREVSSVPGLGVGVNQVSWRGDRIVFEQWYMSGADIHRVPVKDRATLDSEVLVHSPFTDRSAELSPDGTAIVFESYREESSIWRCRADGSNPVLLAGFTEPSGSPHWSPDGTKILFDSLHSGNWDLWTVDPEGGVPRQLTNLPSDEHMGTWSQDGEWIYLTSNRTGRYEIFKMPSRGGEATQMTRQGGFHARESPDGTTVYFTRGPGIGPLFRLSTTGRGEEEVVLPEVGSRDWAVGRQGVYFATSEAMGICGTFCSPEDYRIHYFESRTGLTRELFYRRGRFGHLDLAVSPDEKWVLFSEASLAESELTLAQTVH